MRTAFTAAQLRDDAYRDSDRNLRKCVHCGFCQATCPTYRLSGDELESPRGRIYLIKEMLETEQTPSPEVVRHIDQCLSCLSCMTTCPSGVNYMHLIDHARAWIESHYRRPLADRFKRRLIAALLPLPGRFRLTLRLGRTASRFRTLLPERLRRLTGLATSPAMAPRRRPLLPVYRASAGVKGSVALLAGCVQRATDNGINEATIRVLNRLGYDVHILPGDCCGAIEHHLGMGPRARARMGENLLRWERARKRHNWQALIVNASGCGTMLKDYAHVLADVPDLAGEAQTVSRLCCDITEFLDRSEHDPPRPDPDKSLRVAYQNPCSMQHGQGITDAPLRLLAAYGYRTLPVRDGHLCCGSAGTYNLLQPEIAARLGQDKARVLEAVRPDVIATGNLGCLTQVGTYTDIPVVHTIQLLDWASGGPDPRDPTAGGGFTTPG
ncbi:MAG: glycolate oxidase subunit GlcF [Gammaproteobacteria bacterium]